MIVIAVRPRSREGSWGNGGDYVPGARGNQPALHETLERNLDDMILTGFAGVRHGFVQTGSTATTAGSRRGGCG